MAFPYLSIGKSAAALAAALGLGGAAAQLTRASSLAPLPRAPVYLSATAADHGLQVRPREITYTGDGTGFLGGPSARDRHSGLRWTSWTLQTAQATGFNQLDDCNPSCANGRFQGYPVRVELWRPQTLAGRFVFTRMTIWYTRGRPRGAARHYTFTDAVKAFGGGGYSWWPPTEQVYCVHTGGLKPPAACKNTHELPPS